MTNHSHLLVIDWDYFFPRPDQAKDSHKHLNPTGENAYQTLALYDWSHKEADLWINAIWGIRASGFMTADKDLPTVSGWEGFAQRFTLASNAEVFYGDSNMHAGSFAINGKKFDSVWLYDAHHDAGYKRGMSLKDFRKRNRYSCEDWMLVHALHKARLNWRWPQWLNNADGKHNPQTKGVKVDCREDDGSTPPVTFDAVYICRSGAWVPPWCDDDFERFIESFGIMPQPVDNMTRREFSMEEARNMSDMHKQMLGAAQFHQKTYEEERNK